ncbi:MAG: CDP-alcohol phosphatidyltransferase family protein [Pseudomonadota bacterium]|nr:CDP-alcohol phosphatidyltransferase family protein [Pseudomonadota bacterium]MDO7667303.1 CDP-alcohol phosphatidyltransferase family protein [Pseudomonadota bacterium]MDO7711638.1 CDP-alcohol phosphatidyltransferase family protein [Pseudomonadota bacterium]
MTADFFTALVLFAMAGFSDALDGFLAKHYHWESRLGSILDPLADKLLLVASFAALTWLDLLPYWLLWLVLGRDVLIVVGALAYHYIVGKFELLPLWSSKINTALQISLVLLVMFHQQVLFGAQYWITIMTWLVVGSIINSGGEYLIVWGLRAWKTSKEQ